MTGKIFLNTRKGRKNSKNQYPISCEINNRYKQKMFTIGLSVKIEDWNFKKDEPKNKDLKLLVQKKKIILEDLIYQYNSGIDISLDHIKEALTGKKAAKEKKQDFLSFGYDLAEEKKKIKNSKGILKEGNAESYITALNQLRKIKNKIAITDIRYSLLTEFKNEKLIAGVSKNSIAAYLRALKAIYNEYLRRNEVKIEHDPFKGIFKGVSARKNSTRKRNLPIEAIKILENYDKNLAKGQQYAADLFLLQFYFGGQDFIDIYYLENKQIATDDRIYFTRGKLGENGYEFDLKIFNKAKKILNKYNSNNQFVFSGRKDYKGYKLIVRRINKNLNIIKENYNFHVSNIEKLSSKKYHKLEVLPLKGKITTKVARHTFSTIGNNKFIVPDLLRALMGHERTDVDTIYKDVYPEQERDLNHDKIINTDHVKTTTKYIYINEILEKGKRTKTYKYYNKKNVEILTCSDKKYKFFQKLILVEELT